MLIGLWGQDPQIGGPEWQLTHILCVSPLLVHVIRGLLIRLHLRVKDKILGEMKNFRKAVTGHQTKLWVLVSTQGPGQMHRSHIRGHGGGGGRWGEGREL